MNNNYLDEIVLAQKGGETRGIASICSAHAWVLKAAMQATLKASKTATERQAGNVLLVESTCNQVNQYGGYTGMTPEAFVAYVHGLTEQNGFPPERLVLGGDHLGPSPWQKQPAREAMEKAAGLLQAYVRAGYCKLHLDASMRLGDDDPSRPLAVEVSARRSAYLARVAEETFTEHAQRSPAKGSGSLQGLRYVIGSEVPIPGGATAHEEQIRVTEVADARRTLELTQAAFAAEGLESAWERVVALVVQPGVEFGDDFVLDYQPEAARPLAQFAQGGPFVYEAHSTDYQSGQALLEMVGDHFAILKVGPALTYAFRETVFALSAIENELVAKDEQSHLVEELERAMLCNPADWQAHYHGTPEQQALARKYSLSDRSRYYWGDVRVRGALARLLQNLGAKALPRTLLSQFLPAQLEGIVTGQIENTPAALILDKIQRVLEMYARACG